MTDQDLMDLAIRMGWKTINGRWWTSDWSSEQNTWTWDKVKIHLFSKALRGGGE